MSSILLGLFLISILSSLSSFAATPANEEEFEIRQLALDILERAYPNELFLSVKGNGLHAKIYKKLTHAQFFHVANSEKMPDCAPGGLAFVYLRRRQPEIYLCEFYQEITKVQKAQTLIHEATHLAGVDDECGATRSEIDAMLASGEGVSYQNKYVQKCEISILPSTER